MSFEFEAIGTKWVIECWHELSSQAQQKLLKDIQDFIDQFDRVYSRFRANSVVTEMSIKPGTYTLPENAKPMLELYEQLYRLTEGKVTPLIGNTLSSAGYDAAYSLKPKGAQAALKWEECLRIKGNELTIIQPAILDFGAAGKGYLADLVGNIIQDHGIKKYCVNAGGDIVYKTNDNQLLEIALEHPFDDSLAIGVATLHNQSLCGSSPSHRSWGNYHHIMDPDSATSPVHIAAVWVHASTGLLADGLTTALFFVSPHTLRKHFTFEYAIMKADKSFEKSAGFTADIFEE